MRVKKILLVFFVFLTWSQIYGQNAFPHTVLKNKHIKVGIYLPDTAHGYYRASRFDWSGIISSVKYQQHEYFGEWFEKHDPFVHDAITGPVEEFTAIGFDEVKPGGAFLKIGVGFLEKPDARQYSFSTRYRIIDRGEWTVNIKKRSVAFTQKLTGTNGYAYVYTKTLSIKPGASELVLKHSIRNTGVKTISTTVYNHNLFTIDKITTGKNFILKFPFKPDLLSKNNDSDSLLELKGNSIHYQRDFVKGEKAKIELGGFSSNSNDYLITIENTLTKAGVNIIGNRPIHQLALWCIPSVLSPEPYIKFSIAPGEEFTWDINYVFYQIKS